MKYDAFISYRHLPTDMYVARNLHRALETAKIPKKIQQETGRKRINRVFRDQEELPIGSDLGENIEAALREAENLIVICSPKTKESAWVMKEIDTFISLHGRDNIFAVLVDGEPQDSFPYQILTDGSGNSVEPLAADVRGADKKEIRHKIKSESLRLAAAILGCDYDDLKQRHKERIIKRNMLIAGAAAVFGISFGLYNAYNLSRINENYQQKLVNESRVIAKTSAQLLEAGNRRDAALVAVEGLPVNGTARPFVPEAQYALSNALGNYELGGRLSADKLLEHTVNVSDFEYYPEKGLLLSSDTNNNLYLWDVQKGELLFENKASFSDGFPDFVTCFGMYEDSVILVTSKEIIRLDLQGGINYRISTGVSYFGKAFLSPSGRYVIITDYDYFKVYDVESGEEVKELSLKATDELSDYHFGLNAVFLSDNVFAFDCEADGKNTKVIEVLWDKDTYDSVETKGDQILGLGYTGNGDLVVSSMDEADYELYSAAPMYVQKFDIFSSDPVYTVECTYDNSQKNYTDNKILSRVYQADGNWDYNSEIIVNACKSLYVIDEESGEIINKLVPDGEITGLMIDEDSSDIYVGTINGNYCIMDAVTGLSDSETQGSVDAVIMDMYEDEGILLIRPYMSPYIIVRSDIKDDSALYVDDFSVAKTDSNDHAAVSLDGSSFVVSREGETDADSYDYKVYYDVYDAKTNEKLQEFTLDSPAVGQFFYLDEDTIVTYDSKGLIYHNIKDDKTDTLSFSQDGDFHSFEPVFSASGKYAVIYGVSENYISVVDVKERQFISSGTICSPADFDAMPNAAVISDDGKKAYYINGYAKTCCYDSDEGQATEVLEELISIGIALSDDGKLLLVNCADGFIRVVDTGTFNIVDTVEFNGEYGSLMRVSEDNSKLFLQGADYLFRIYDLESKEFVYEAVSQDNRILQISEDTPNNLLIYRDRLRLYTMDTESFGLLAGFDRGLAYLSGANSVISADDSSIYRFKCKSLEDLEDEVKEKYGDHELSLRERRMYGLE